MRRSIQVIAGLVLAGSALTACGFESQPMGTTEPTADSSSASGGNSSTPSAMNTAEASPSLAAARKAAIDFGSYDYRTIKKSGWSFLNDLTSTFKVGYSTQTGQFETFVVTNKGVSTAKVTSAQLASNDGSKAVAEVIVAQHVTGTGTTTDISTKLRLILIKQADGRWLVDAASVAQ